MCSLNPDRIPTLVASLAAAEPCAGRTNRRGPDPSTVGAMDRRSGPTTSSLGLEVFTPYADELGLGHARAEWKRDSVLGGSLGRAHEGRTVRGPLRDQRLGTIRAQASLNTAWRLPPSPASISSR